MLPKHVRRRTREYGFVAIKVIFLIGMGVAWLSELVIDIFWLRPVVNFLGRCLGYFDGWLSRRSLWFVLVIFGILGVIGLALLSYKGYLLYNHKIVLLAIVELAEKFSYSIVLHHLWRVYRNQLLTFAFIKRIYDKCMMIRAEAIAWALRSDVYQEALAIKRHLREDWFRYSMVPFARRAARTRPCCLLNWL